ncbi:MAG: HAMP domain-containing sensor histidine kinase, partial [Deltaproteobacteria bacterium]
IALSGARTRVFGDREKLTDLFLTITDNAVKYNRQGGRVAIEVKEGVDEAVVTIEDTGRGIPAGEREKVFDRFFRGADTGGVEPGSGLGLSIAKTLAARHGGGITLESEVGKGSVFKVILPKKDKKD